MPKLKITDPKLLAFCRNLADAAAEHPSLKLDLSKPGHCGLIRMLDVRLKRTGEVFPDDHAFTVYDQNGDNNPFDVTEKYAFMPADENGDYVNPAPEGSETDPAWMLANQKGFRVEGDTVTTDLDEAQLNNLFKAAQAGRLYAVIPGHELNEFGFGGGVQIRADGEGSVRLVGDLDLTHADITSMDRDTRAMFEYVTAISEKFTASNREFDSDSEEMAEMRNTSTCRQFFWSSQYHDMPVMSKEEIGNTFALSVDEGVYLSTYEDLMRYSVVDHGKVRPLVDPDTLNSLADKDISYAVRYAQSKLADAVIDGKPLYFYDDRKERALSCHEKRGVISGRDVDQAIDGVEKPRFYFWKNIVNFFSKGRYPEVDSYKKRLEAEQVKAYYGKNNAILNEKLAQREQSAKQRKNEDKEALRQYTELHPSPALRPADEADTHVHMIPFGSADSLIGTYEEKYGPLPDDFKDSLIGLNQIAADAEEKLRADAMCENTFTADEEARNILAYRTVARAMQTGPLTPALISLVTDDRIGEVIAGDNQLSYVTGHSHSGSFYLGSLLTPDKLDSFADLVVYGAERIAAREAIPSVPGTELNKVLDDPAAGSKHPQPEFVPKAP